jgi:hypothetical protein
MRHAAVGFVDTADLELWHGCSFHNLAASGSKRTRPVGLLGQAGLRTHTKGISKALDQDSTRPLNVANWTQVLQEISQAFMPSIAVLRYLKLF